MKRKKWLSLLIAFTFLFHGALPLQAANFADINQVPWSGAETYINKVADAGLMVGDTNTAGNKVFRPKDSVTYCETAQLAYTLLASYYGTQVTADVQSKYTSTLQAYSIPTWAYPACAFCLDKGALVASDLSLFMQGASSANATRENVGLIFGRALSNMTAVNSNATLTFKDVASISKAAIPYIDLLVRTGIINGDSAGNFNPKNTINRSEMAVIVAKTNDYLATLKSSSSVGVISGTIDSITTSGSQKKLTIRSGSTTQTLTGSNSTPCLQNGSSIDFSSLQTGDQVTVSYQGETISSVIRLNSAGSTTSANTVSGTYVGMNNSVINVDVSGRTYTYNMANEVSFVLGGYTVNLNNMIASAEYGDRITLTLNSSNEIVKAVVTLKSSKYDVKGYYKSMDTSSITLKKTKTSSSSTKYYFEDKDSSKVDFYIDGTLTTYSKFKNEVSSNDDIELVYNDDDEVIEVRLEDDEVDYDEEGYFYEIDSEYIRITKSKSSSSSTRYYFEDKDYDNVDFYIDGDSSSYSKFKNAVDDGDKIGLILNSDDEVTEVYLIEDDDDYDEDGYFASMTDSYISIKSSKSSSSSTKYYFEDDDYDNVDFYVDGSSKSYSKFEDTVEKNDRIGLVLNSDDEVTKVYLITDDDDYDEDGYFTSMTDSYISIKSSKSSSSSTKYYFEDEDYDNVDFYVDGSSKSYSKFEDTVAKNDKIGLVLNSDDEVTKVYLIDSDDKETEIEGYLGEVDSKGEYLTFKKTKSSSAVKYYFEDEDYSNVDFYVDGSSTSYSKFKYAAQENDELELVLNSDDEIVEVYLTIASEEEASGTLSSLSSSKLKLSGSSKSYTLADEDDLTIKVKDGSDFTITSLSELDDAYNEDDKTIEVELVINVDDEVTKITGYVSEVTGELRSIDAQDETLKVRGDSGTSITYTCASSCSVKIASSKYDNDLDGLEEAFDDDRDIEVTLSLNSSGKITSIRADW